MALSAHARALLARARPYAPALFVSFGLGAVAIRAIVHEAGHTAAPLDDAFIHLEYARRIAEGAPFHYSTAGAASTGATSLAWPFLLAPFYAIGFHDTSLLWITWLFGTLAHAAVAVETARVASRLTGPRIGVTAGAMCLAFGAFAWFAWSGMETVPLAWILMRCVRLTGDVCEPDAARPVDEQKASRALALAGFIAPLVRPEGILGSIVAALGLALGRRKRVGRASAVAIVPLAGALVVPALNLIVSGHAASATATVKWLVLNPYVDSARLVATFAANARLLIGDLLDGGDWTTLFLPEGTSLLFVLGGVALIVAAARRARPVLGVALAIVALGALIPCTYLSFLWNRVRYIWPFSAAHFVLIACLADGLGEIARRFSPRLVFLGPVLGGAFAGALATRLPWAVRDLAESAAAIDRQQVSLGRWAAENLPRGARIGVNDTGAIAYVSNRATFDVVGLTTEGEAPYWVAGPGSRFEHYEHLAKDRLPTHFIVYPAWMACPAVLGSEVHEATVVDQSILGGTTMIAYEARWDALGTGALPFQPPPGVMLDELDVADLESERAHDYHLGKTSEADDLVATSFDRTVDPPRRVTEGGRFRRTKDQFRLHFGAERHGRLVLRIGADEETELDVSIAGRDVGAVVAQPGQFDDASLDVTSESADAAVVVSAPPGTSFDSFHYWLYAAP